MDLIYGCRMPGNNDSRLLLYKTDPMAGLAIRSCASLSALGTTGFGGMGLLSELSYVWERRNPAPEDDPRKKYFAHNWAWALCAKMSETCAPWIMTVGRRRKSHHGQSIVYSSAGLFFRCVGRFGA